MNYYAENFQEYIKKTENIDMKESYEMFLKYIDKKSSIIDVGFGSARDMIYFNSLGYSVNGIDIVNEFVEHARKLGFSVENHNILNFKPKELVDAAWCNASLLHLNRLQIKEAFENLKSNILKNDKIVFASFKYGDNINVIDKFGRHFFYCNEIFIKSLNYKILEIKISKDLLNRDNNWMSVVLSLKD